VQSERLKEDFATKRGRAKASRPGRGELQVRSLSAGLAFLGLWGFGEGLDFLGFEEAVAAAGDVFDGERAEADAMNFFDGVMFAEKSAPEGFEFGAEHADFVPIVGGVAAHGVGLANDFHFDAGLLVEALDVGERKHALDFEMIGLLEMIPVFEELGGEVAIVGHEDESGGGVFEITDGINALREAAKKIAKGFASFRIGECGDDFGGLVEEEVDVALIGIDGAASGFDFVLGGIGLGAKFGDDFAVDADLAGEDELFGVTAGRDAGSGDDFLKAFEHEGMHKDNRERERRRKFENGKQKSGNGERKPKTHPNKLRVGHPASEKKGTRIKRWNSGIGEKWKSKDAETTV